MLRDKPTIVFDGRTDAAGFLCEAFVAGQAARLDSEGHEWLGGRSLVDVHFGSNNVDVKRGFIETVLTAAGPTECLGFMGAKLSDARPVQARDGVTAYAIVVPNEHGAVVSTHINGAVTLEMAPPESWYLVPSKVINSLFQQKRNAQSEPSGLNLYCPLPLLDEWKMKLV